MLPSHPVGLRAYGWMGNSIRYSSFEVYCSEPRRGGGNVGMWDRDMYSEEIYHSPNNTITQSSSSPSKFTPGKSKK